MLFVNIRHKVSRLLNPALCLCCGVGIDAEYFFCAHCLDDLEQVKNACPLCGLPYAADPSVCAPCNHKPPRWQRMIAPLVYTGGTRKLIQELKFRDKIYHANALVSHLHSHFSGQQVDALLPVPLHSDRLRDRGFNQAQEIAARLAHFLRIPTDPLSLTRIRATDSQSGLSLNKRQQNIVKAFRYEPAKRYRSVAVVDDVITTGSTMAEITKVLRKAGVESVQVWSLARALKQQ